jgi:hypothetical protein
MKKEERKERLRVKCRQGKNSQMQWMIAHTTMNSTFEEEGM